MSSEELESRQVYFIQTEGPDGLQNTEVLITDLGEIGENAIVVYEEAVGVGAEETVIGGVETVEDLDAVGYLESESDVLQVFPDVEHIKLESNDLGTVKLDPDLGVHYETVEDVSLGDTTRVFLSVDLDEDSDKSDVISLSSNSQELLTEQPLNLVKKDKKRKLSFDGKSQVFLCKLCNAYISKSIKDTHNRDVHGNVDRLSCSDCGKLFTSKRSLFGHKKEKHSGAIEIFTCPDCGKNFSRKSNLKAHRDSLHFGKKFPCSYCDRIFTNRSSMNQHIKKTHVDVLQITV